MPNYNHETVIHNTCFDCFLLVNLVHISPSGGNIYKYMPHAFKHIHSISNVAICLDTRTASVTQGQTTVHKLWPDKIKLVSMWVVGWSVSQSVYRSMDACTCVLTQYICRYICLHCSKYDPCSPTLFWYEVSLNLTFFFHTQHASVPYLHNDFTHHSTTY